MKRILCTLLLPLVLMAQPATAQSAGSQAECERKYPNPMEFNLCLASLAPVRGRVTPDKMPAGADQARRGRGSLGAIRSLRRGGGRISSTIYLGGAPVQKVGGRKRVTFDVRR